MGKIVLEIPDEVLISLKETAAEFPQDMRVLTAVKLYQMGGLSSGGAAQLAGVSASATVTALLSKNSSGTRQLRL